MMLRKIQPGVDLRFLEEYYIPAAHKGFRKYLNYRPS